MTSFGISPSVKPVIDLLPYTDVRIVNGIQGWTELTPLNSAKLCILATVQLSPLIRECIHTADSEKSNQLISGSIHIYIAYQPVISGH